MSAIDSTSPKPTTQTGRMNANAFNLEKSGEALKGSKERCP